MVPDEDLYPPAHKTVIKFRYVAPARILEPVDTLGSLRFRLVHLLSREGFILPRNSPECLHSSFFFLRFVISIRIRIYFLI